MKLSCALIIVFGFLQTRCRPTPLIKEAPEVNEVKANKAFRITLPEDHRNGYTWQIIENYDKNVVLRLNEVWHGNEKGIDFNLRTKSAGQSTLTFIQRKYTDTLNVRSYIVKIKS